MIYETAVFRIHPEKQVDFLESARRVIAQAPKEPGCLSYDLASSVMEAGRFVLLARWTSRDALRAHHATPQYGEWLRLASGYVVDSKIEVILPETVEEL